MRVIFTVLFLCVIVFVVAGFYLGWFRVSGGQGGGKSHVTMTVDQSKMNHDKDKVVNDVKNIKPASTRPAPVHSPNNTSGVSSTDNQMNQ
ncbi:MAG: hypothetical protein HKL95_05960 [Phycisphaerae bacterium]|nr:hypothetical protein [Phycisphaerae bacterium]